jgi:hypothetical protein
MKRNMVAAVASAALTVFLIGCSSDSTPAAPTAPGTPASGDSSLKVTAPTAQSPVNGQMLASLLPTLTASPSTPQFAAVALQYRFEIFNEAGVLAQDSGLVGGSTWTTKVALTPNAKFTWKVRAEYQGASGPWSSAAAFSTPDPPPAYGKPIGDWQKCGSLVKDIDLAFCVWDAVRPGNLVDDMEVVKRIAWLRRSQGAGLLIKNGGEGAVLWQGYSFSASRICFPDGHIYKVIIDAGAGGSNLPTFADNDFVDTSLYVPAIDPSKP